MGSLGSVLRDHVKNHEMDQIEQIFRASKATDCTLTERESRSIFVMGKYELEILQRP